MHKEEKVMERELQRERESFTVLGAYRWRELRDKERYIEKEGDIKRERRVGR